jgi:hypothetical protein
LTILSGNQDGKCDSDDTVFENMSINAENLYIKSKTLSVTGREGP